MLSRADADLATDGHARPAGARTRSPARWPTSSAAPRPRSTSELQAEGGRPPLTWRARSPVPPLRWRHRALRRRDDDDRAPGPHRLLTEVDGDVWRITLDRPENGNALDPALAAELAAAFRDRPEETRAVLLLANGPRFCVGGDVHAFAGAEDPGAVRRPARARLARGHPAGARLTRCR